ncbi:hypothetical protein PCANC_03112 [Puccinia coronata f. sp. avenae]|nr:hypothetical protein PCANC_03112 [Puccinia coronata f. sp. avenae]
MSQPPPSYAEASHQASSLNYPASSSTIHHLAPRISVTAHRFPTGLFVLRNRSSLKMLDVRGAGTLVGTPVIAYDPKRPTLVNDDLLHKDNNQLFFIDWHGCLCAANCGLRVDVGEDYELELRKPTPLFERATRESHPPALFQYDPCTRTIAVHFQHDPSFSDTTIEDVNKLDYLLEVVPLSSSSTAAEQSSYSSTFQFEKLTEWLIPSFSTQKPNTPSPAQASCSTSSPAPNSSVSADPPQPHAEEEEEEDEHCDNSEDPARIVRVVSVAPGWREKFPSSDSPEARKWRKRQWDIASVILQPSNPPPPHPSLPTPPPPHHHQPGVLDDLGDVLVDLRHDIVHAFSGGSNPS